MWNTNKTRTDTKLSQIAYAMNQRSLIPALLLQTDQSERGPKCRQVQALQITGGGGGAVMVGPLSKGQGLEFGGRQSASFPLTDGSL